MEDDEIMKEVRRIRDEIAARFNYDGAAIGAHYLELQEKCGIKTVSLPPRKPLFLPVTEITNDEPNTNVRPKPQFGRAQGTVSLAADFDEPLADFEEYLQ